MATLTASAAQANAQPIYNAVGTVERTVFFTHNIALSAGDVVQMFKIPNGAQVNSVAISAISFSAGVVTVNIGDGNDVSAYGAAVVLSGSVISVATMTGRGLGRSYSAEDTIDLVVTAISAPPATATIALTISYTNQGNSTGG